ncbi:hemolysin III [Dolosicoccus paucivorans]|uniref:Hemolysin III n=1 Tax=Dolosicoccus paucivorans TaxID=84521 RepID=A0A2N6SPU6_9LACT|nr:hemolysin III family protein [Dolosicoccus paucivorans]PMB84148.1 hemolysin III [Dolosicoccus paucivorans]PMC59092.1 hemolysin III [Dolosicoccus paucivorans]
MNHSFNRRYHIIVEVLNATTHGIAAALSVVGMIFLILKAIKDNNTLAITAFSIYGVSLFILFLNSTLYHSFSFTQYKNFFQKLDHSSIYLLIAGTYTPYLMLAIGGRLGWTFLTLIWTLAIAGIIFEAVNLDKYPRLSTFFYLLLGWLALFIIYPLYQSVPLYGIVWLALGGIMYSVGTIFYRMKSIKWMHIIWHLFVIAGAAFMFVSIWHYI